MLVRAGRPPLPVHRLDQDTSGVVLFSKDKATCPRVHAQFQEQVRAHIYAQTLNLADSAALYPAIFS